MALDLSHQHVFSPVLLSRRGEVIAWGLTVIMFITWLILRTMLGRFSLVALILSDLFLLSALSISLGNWMDRRTELVLDEQGIGFRNGLRKVVLSWGAIESVRVTPAPFGASKVQVVGDHAHFDLRTMGVVRLSGAAKGQTGFQEGEAILSTILEKAGLQLDSEPNPGSYYYLRR